jgi:formate dehydrogenase (NADP+) beta subunit
VAERDGSTEIDNGLTQRQAQAEGQRSFSCSNCLACDGCWNLCPDIAVLKTRDIAADGSHHVFDYGYCKGVCAPTSVQPAISSCNRNLDGARRDS